MNTYLHRGDAVIVENGRYNKDGKYIDFEINGVPLKAPVEDFSLEEYENE